MKLAIVLLLVMIPSITTLRCYVCNSLTDPECENGNGLERFQQVCSQVVEPYCRKIVQTVEKQKSIVRSCGSKKGNKDCYKTAGLNSANVCSCDGDLCNTAASFNRQQQLLTILSSAIAVAISMLFLR